MTKCIQLQKRLYHAFATLLSSKYSTRGGISLRDFIDLDHILNIEELRLCLTDIEGRQQFCCMRTVQIQRYVCQ